MNARDPTPSGVISSPEPNQQTSIQKIIGAPTYTQQREPAKTLGPASGTPFKRTVTYGDDEGANLTESSANFESDEKERKNTINEGPFGHAAVSPDTARRGAGNLIRGDTKKMPATQR